MNSSKIGKLIMIIFLGIMVLSSAIADNTTINENSTKSESKVSNTETQNGSSEELLVGLEQIINTTLENKNQTGEKIPNETIQKTEVNLTNETNMTKSPELITQGSGSGGSYIELPENEEEKPVEDLGEKIDVTITKEGRVEIKGKIPKSFDVNSIEKTEIEKSGSKKEIVVSSKNHLNDSITVYTDIPKISTDKKDSVKVHWVNENKNVNVREFIDTNGDGFYDRISWEVPHLSTQTFEVIIEATFGNSSTINITVNSPAEGSTQTPKVNFSFNIGYVNISPLNCGLSINNGTQQILNENISASSPTLSTNKGLADGSYSWNLNCTDGTEFENVSGNFTISENYSISLKDNKNEYLSGENVTLIANSKNDNKITIKLRKPSTAEISFNNLDKNIFFTIPPSETLQPGIYTLTAIFDNLNQTHEESINFSVTEASQQSTSNKPVIELISPEDNVVINRDRLKFKYKVTGTNVSKCEFLWYRGSSFNWSETKSNIVSGQVLETQFEEDVEGDYTWYVVCDYGNGEEVEKFRELTFSLTDPSENYEGSDKVKNAERTLNNFTELEKSLGLEEKEVLEDLGITKNITLFRKKLPQIRTDLSENINTITSEERRIQKREDAIKYLESIVKYTPSKVEVVDKEEFSKTSLPRDLESIIERYSDANSLGLSKTEIKKLAEFNEKLQREISVTTDVKHLRIEFDGDEKEMTLVAKEVSLKNDSFNTILEAVSENFGTAQFMTPNKKVDGSLFEIEADDLEGGKIVYYVEDFVVFDDVKDSETILFENAKVTFSGITGFSIFEFDSDISIFYFLIIIGGLLALAVASRGILVRINLNGWKKEENVNRILESIEEAKNALRYDNTESARENYHKIKGLFKLVPEGFRKYSMPEIEKIRMGIDRRDIIGFVKEYEKAAMQGRKNDAKILFEKIKATYKRLLKEDQEKIYKKLFKKDFEL